MRHKHWGEAETGGAQPQPHSPGAVRGRKESPCSLWGGARPCRHLNFSLLASERESISVVLGCQFVGICYSGPRTLTHARSGLELAPGRHFVPGSPAWFFLPHPWAPRKSCPEDRPCARCWGGCAPKACLAWWFLLAAGPFAGMCPAGGMGKWPQHRLVIAALGAPQARRRQMCGKKSSTAPNVSRICPEPAFNHLLSRHHAQPRGSVETGWTGSSIRL